MHGAAPLLQLLGRHAAAAALLDGAGLLGKDMNVDQVAKACHRSWTAPLDAPTGTGPGARGARRPAVDARRRARPAAGHAGRRPTCP